MRLLVRRAVAIGCLIVTCATGAAPQEAPPATQPAAPGGSPTGPVDLGRRLLRGLGGGSNATPPPAGPTTNGSPASPGSPPAAPPPAPAPAPAPAGPAPTRVKAKQPMEPKGLAG